MEVIPPSRVRTVALVGHGGAGKTTLAEALLHRAGVVGRPGRVEDGTTVTDTEPEEVRRRISLSLAVATFEHAPQAGPTAGTRFRIHLLDTPGDADFVAEAHAALAVCDLAVFVLSAVEGVEVQTEALWEAAADRGVPRMVFVNKLDRERADFDRTLDQLRSAFGAGVAPLELPIGRESGFRGVVDLLSDTAYFYDEGDGRARAGAIPDELDAREHAIHDSLVEGIVVADDGLLERYLDGDPPGYDELEAVLADGVRSATVFPVVCGSATTAVGIDRLLALVCEVGPSPVDRPVTVLAGDTTVDVACDPDGDALAVVFDTIADPYVGRISVFKVLSGTIRPDRHLVNTRTGAEERLHQLVTRRGHQQLPVDQLAAGDIGGVAKLAATLTGDTLAPRGRPVVVPWSEPPPAPLAIAVRPRSQHDDDKLVTALHRLVEEDPSLRVSRDDDTHQTVLHGLGETHLAVSLERLARKFGVELETDAVHLPYRETITAGARGEGRYKKQTGGHGQFGVAVVEIEPLERGGGFEWVDAVVGGAIPRSFVAAVERGVLDAMATGGRHGHPVVDVRVRCVDGRAHAVDSSEGSFRMAGAMAFRAAFEQARSVVLEPVSRVEVVVPGALQGDVLGDLNARRGRVQGTEAEGRGRQRITALVPTVELARYAVDLRSLTGGRGRFEEHHDHYGVVPDHLADRVGTPVSA